MMEEMIPAFHRRKTHPGAGNGLTPVCNLSIQVITRREGGRAYARGSLWGGIGGWSYSMTLLWVRNLASAFLFFPFFLKNQAPAVGLGQFSELFVSDLLLTQSYNCSHFNPSAPQAGHSAVIYIYTCVYIYTHCNIYITVVTSYIYNTHVFWGEFLCYSLLICVLICYLLWPSYKEQLKEDEPAESSLLSLPVIIS